MTEQEMKDSTNTDMARPASDLGQLSCCSFLKIGYNPPATKPQQIGLIFFYLPDSCSALLWTNWPSGEDDKLGVDLLKSVAEQDLGVAPGHETLKHKGEGT